MRVLVRGGTIVSSNGMYTADVVCDDGVITAVSAPGRWGDIDETVDASGALVFPGFIDPHVHSRDPGLTHKEDFEHSTAAAAVGGVTTILEMPNVVPPLSDLETFRQRAAYFEQHAHVDFGLWGMSLGSANLDALASLIAEGVAGIKLFWGYALDRKTSELVYNVEDRLPEDLVLPPGNGDVLELFKAVAIAGGLLAAHCEDREVNMASARAIEGRMAAYDDLLESRPEVAEAAAIAVGVEFARFTSCRFHVVHVSSARGLELIRQARAAGLRVTAETCPQYLTLTDESFATTPSMKVYPPIRRRQDRDALWGGLVDGTIDSIGSDHAPHTVEEKQQPLATQPAGAVGVETMARIMITEARRRDLPMERIAWLLSEGTARIYGLYPRKGEIRPGADADMTLVDPEREWVIRNRELHSLHPVSPWDGVSGTGAPVRTLVRGKTVMVDGELVGEPGWGRLVRSARDRVNGAITVGSR